MFKTKAMSLVTPETKAYIGSLGVPLLIASKTGVAGNALASTALDFVTGITLATHSPTFVIFKFNSGTVGINQSRIKTDAGYLLAATLLTSLNATDSNYVASLAGAVRSTGNISVEVTAAGLTASTLDVFVYGVVKP